MHCFYINLDTASERRAALETSFKQNISEGWELVRIPAWDNERVRRCEIPGNLHPGEKACYLSHLKAIEMIIDLQEPALVVEDDTKFGPQSLALIEASIDQANNQFTWDLLFTDVGFFHPIIIAQLLVMRREIMQSRTVHLKHLKNTGFFAASAYVVNPRSAARLLDDLKVDRFDIPFDLACRQKIDIDLIKGIFTFPFLTTLSSLADHSTIERGSRDEREGGGQSWNLLRRLLWLEGDTFDPQEDAQEIWRRLGSRSQLIGAILADAFNNLPG